MKIAILLASLFFGMIAQAGNDQGGGGIGVPLNGKIYLYDFIEAGIKDTVYINPNGAGLDEAAPYIRASIPTTPEVQNLIIAKINEIFRLSPEVAIRFLEVIKTYQWRWSEPRVQETHDIGQTPIRINLEQKQIAFRDDRQKVVTIDKEYLQLMPIEHQAGLYLHEIVYALTRGYDSYKARIFNGYIFSPTFAMQTFTQFHERVALAFDGWDVKSYSVYQTLTSSEFKVNCDEFRGRVDKFITPNLKTFDSMFNEYVQTVLGRVRSSNCDGSSSTQQAYSIADLKMETTFWQNAQTIFPSEPVTFYKKLACERTTIFGNDKTVNLYSLSSRTESKVRSLINAAALIDQENKSKYYGQCLDDQESKIVKGFGQLNISN